MAKGAQRAAVTNDGMTTPHLHGLWNVRPERLSGTLGLHGHSFCKPLFMEPNMRRTIPLLASLATLAAVVVSAPAAQAASDRYCLQGRIWGYPGNCQFASYQQCLATASGTNASCGINPRYAFRQQRQSRY